MNKLFFTIVMFISIGVQAQTNFDHLFDKWKNNKVTPGITIAILHEGKTVFKKETGYENLEYKIPLSNKSVFDIASLAKQFTGFAIAKLIVENKLNLNDPAARYLPELEILQQGILIKHLVYHTSGLRDVGELFGLANLGEIFTSKEALLLIKNQKELNFSFGTEYDYSNTNYVLLALIVERISGKSFREWCTSNIFDPLKMENSFVNDNPYEIIKNRAVAYYSSGDSFSYNQNNGMALIGSSAVYSTIDDMILWLQALQNEKAFSKVFGLMKQKGKLDNGEEVRYGFGLGIGNFRNEIMIEHSGATPSGFRTQIALFPEQSLGFVVLSSWGNIDPINDFGRPIIESFLPIPVEDKKELGTGKTDSPNIILTQKMIDQYLGDYLFNKESSVKIRHDQENNKLTIQLEERPVVDLIPLSETEFDLPALNSILTFEVNQEGICNKVEVSMNDKKEGELTRVGIEEKVSVDYNKYVGKFYSEELGILYELKKKNNQFILNNTQFGEVILIEKSKEVFAPQEGIASSLFFIFDDTNSVIGFLLNRGSRARNLKFMKL